MTSNWDLLADRPLSGAQPTVFSTTAALATPLPQDDARLLAVVAAAAARYTGRPSIRLGWSDGGPWRDVTVAVDLDASFVALISAAAAALAAPRLDGPPLDGRPTVGVGRADAPDAGAPALLTVRADGSIRHAVPNCPAEVVQRFAGHVVELARGLDSDRAVGQLPMLAAAELARMYAHNAAGPLPDETATLPALIAEQVRRTPDAVAVRTRDDEISYSELWRRSGVVATTLADAGAAVGANVGVWVDRGSADCMIGLLGVLRSGAAYVALEPRYPIARLRAVIEAATLHVVVGSAASPELGLRIVATDAATTSDAAFGRGAPGPARPDDLAYVMFTSGSTGMPKGVMIEHRNVVNLLRHMATDPGLRPGETMLGVTTPAFDLSVPDLFLPLITGATLALADPESTTDGVRLAEQLASHRPDLMQATPSTWRMLLSAGWRGDPGLRIVCGGEGYDAELVRRLADKVAGIWNFYGPTETTVWSTSRLLDAWVTDPIPIGEPVRRTACFVLDERDQPVPAGVRGEVVIAGAGVARGYLHRPDLTAAAFVPCTFPGAPSPTMYRTGDLGRISIDGELTFAGRRDHQVKVNGFRVELGEVESVMATLPGVTQAVATVATSGDVSRLVCYVTGETVRGDELRHAAAQVLAPQSVPAVVVVLDEFPLSANGKVDRSALPAPAEGSARSGAPLDGPFEELVAQVWAEVLSLPAVFADDDIFGLGAYSLDIGRIAIRLSDELSLDVTPGLIFRHSSVRQLAATLLELIAEAEADLLRAAEAP